MDTSELIPKLESVAPKGVLDVRPFGRGKRASIWVEMKSIIKIAQALKDDANWKLDWLENLSVMEMEGALVLNYFLRSTSNSSNSSELMLRGTLMPSSSDEEVEALSVVSVWPMVRDQEREIADLFGIRFLGNDTFGKLLLPKAWPGYPLRKSYIFPTEYFDIPHMRPAGQTGPDEFGASR